MHFYEYLITKIVSNYLNVTLIITYSTHVRLQDDLIISFCICIKWSVYFIGRQLRYITAINVKKFAVYNIVLEAKSQV